jgi:GPH family glycoside/pentoside/hexuronide:cation symporter
MFLPPVTGDAAAAWLALTSMVTYLAYSVVSIAYQAWGSGLGQTPSERARVTAMREGFGLAGVLAASALLAPEHARTLIVCFVLLSVTGLADDASRTLRRGARAASARPRPASLPRSRGGAGRRPGRPGGTSWATRCSAGCWPRSCSTAWPPRSRPRWCCSSPATCWARTSRRPLMLLVAYFLAGALGMPLWTRLARRFGLRNAWLLGMAFAVLAFMWALGPGPRRPAGLRHGLRADRPGAGQRSGDAAGACWRR